MQTISSFSAQNNGIETKDKAKALRARIDESVDALAKAADDIESLDSADSDTKAAA